MNKVNKTKQLMKIVIGAAWVDGVIQPEEREYLKKMATDTNLIHDPEIKSLLSEIRPVSIQECYKWLEDYLGKSRKKEDYQKLLESVSGLVYSDGQIEVEEARLLSRLQDLDFQTKNPDSVFKSLLGSIKKIYAQAINN